jgi:hypothetical protein
VEGILAIGGFWTFCILAMLRFSKSRQSRAQDVKEIELLKSRISVLEQDMSVANHQMLEFKEGHDFAMRLLTDAKKVKSGV